MIIDELVVDRVPGATYDWRDLNRVAEAMEYIACKLHAAGYDISIRMDYFARDSLPSESLMLRYIEQIRKMRNALKLPISTPPIPGCSRSRPWLTVQEANDIERILLAVEHQLQNMASAWYYCGELYAGEV